MCSTVFVEKMELRGSRIQPKGTQIEKKDYHHRFQRVKLPWVDFYNDWGTFIFIVHTCLNARERIPFVRSVRFPNKLLYYNTYTIVYL